MSIQQFLRRALSEAGYQVDKANSAKVAEGFGQWKESMMRFIVDLGLPDLNGLEIDRPLAECSLGLVLSAGMVEKRMPLAAF